MKLAATLLLAVLISCYLSQIMAAPASAGRRKLSKIQTKPKAKREAAFGWGNASQWGHQSGSSWGGNGGWGNQFSQSYGSQHSYGFGF
jgi:hypothetical protein